jgi:hypothetical protein
MMEITSVSYVFFIIVIMCAVGTITHNISLIRPDTCVVNTIEQVASFSFQGVVSVEIPNTMTLETQDLIDADGSSVMT